MILTECLLSLGSEAGRAADAGGFGADKPARPADKCLRMSWPAPAVHPVDHAEVLQAAPAFPAGRQALVNTAPARGSTEWRFFCSPLYCQHFSGCPSHVSEADLIATKLPKRKPTGLRKSFLPVRPMSRFCVLRDDRIGR